MQKISQNSLIVQVRRFAHKKTSWLKSVQNRLPFLNRKQSSVRTGNGTAENGDVVDNQKADDDDMIPRPKNVYGSLYLRLGAVSKIKSDSFTSGLNNIVIDIGSVRHRIHDSLWHRGRTVFRNEHGNRE